MYIIPLHYNCQGAHRFCCNLALAGPVLVDTLTVEIMAGNDDVHLFALWLAMSSSTHFLTLLNSANNKLGKMKKR
jgi:hypothetical protein